MKKLLLAALGAGALGVVAACSQGETHPPLLGDCTGCSNPIVPVVVPTIDASTTDASTNDASTNDVSAPDASDAGADADDGSALDGALPG